MRSGFTCGYIQSWGGGSGGDRQTAPPRLADGGLPGDAGGEVSRDRCDSLQKWELLSLDQPGNLQHCPAQSSRVGRDHDAVCSLKSVNTDNTTHSGSLVNGQ